MHDLPTGTVTFVFTDIEGSTRLLQHLGDDYVAVLDEHARLIRRAIEDAGGTEVATEGDAFFCVFPTAPQAISASTAMQQALAAHSWPDGTTVRVRVGMHTGEGLLGGDNYAGLDVHRAARISSAGHGGQVLLSQTTRALAEHALPEGVALRDLGEHRLKDLEHAEHLHQLLIDGLAQDFPPLRSLDPVLHNLPIQLTSFLGREAELSEVVSALSRSRLVTLTGPGGTGKTRLAIEAAERVAGATPDGVWYVALEPIADPTVLPTAIVESLGLQHATGEPYDHLAQHFASRDAVLVLDNFEQVLAAGPTVAMLLRDCPKLRVLVTSRAPLRVTGEQELPIPPLPTPEEGHDVEAEESPAVQLFVERAQAARPDFALDDENRAIVAEITMRLDGLPLAIELAAALLKLLPPRAILDRLGRRLDVLTGGPQDLPQRQRSLRGAIAWSYELLDDHTRLLLEHMAVFAGGASFDMVEQVCAPAEIGMLLDALRTLVDQSLVVQSDEGGEPRFSLLGAIRDFALERLEARGQADEARARLGTVFLAVVEEAGHGLRGPDEARWVTVLNREFDNVRAVMTWALERDDADVGLRIVTSLDTFAYMGARDEMLRWTETAIEIPGAGGHERYPAACGSAAMLAVLRGDLPLARELAERGLDAAPEPNDPRRFNALEALSEVASFEGRLDETLEFMQAIRQISDDPFEQTRILPGESLALTYSGDVDGGVAAARQLQRAAEEIGNPTLRAWGYYTEGEALMQRDPTRALALLEEAIAVAATVDSRFLVGVAQVSASSVRARHGDALMALTSFRQLVEQWRRDEHGTQLWTTLRTVADIFARLDALEAAAVLHTALVDVPRGAPAFGDDAERLAALAARFDAELDPERCETARTKGRSMTDDEVIDYTLAEMDRLLAERS
jgi:predicted ATPase/class 3 adenylate cyclase